MNIPSVSVTRPSHFEPGAFYVIKGVAPGTNMPIPKQVFECRSKPEYDEATGRLFVRGVTYIDAGRGPEKLEGPLFLDSVGIFEGFSSVQDWARDAKTQPLIERDIHVERVSDHFMKALNNS